jgi:CheY-like chemotaxis protein
MSTRLRTVQYGTDGWIAPRDDRHGETTDESADPPATEDQDSTRHIPIVAVTENGTASEIERAIRAGCTSVLSHLRSAPGQPLS